MKLSALNALPLAALLVLTTSAYAQGGPGRPGAPGGAGRPGGPGGAGRPGGFQLTPAQQAQFQAWQTARLKWRDSHKNVTALDRTLRALTELEQDPQSKLTKPQAKTILAVMNKWQSKPVLTDAQAAQVNKQITAPLTFAQLKKVAAASQDRRGNGFGGGPGGFGGRPGGSGAPGSRPGAPGARPGGGAAGFGGGRPGGPGAPGGGRPGGPNFAALAAPKDYNPLNPATQPNTRGRDRSMQRHAQLIAALTASAK